MERTKSLCILVLIFVLIASNLAFASEQLKNPKDGYEGPYTVVGSYISGNRVVTLMLWADDETKDKNIYTIMYRDSIVRFLMADKLKIKFRYDNGWEAEIFNLDASEDGRGWVCCFEVTLFRIF